MNQQDGKKLARLLSNAVGGLEDMTKILEKELNNVKPKEVEPEVFEKIQSEVKRFEGELQGVKESYEQIVNKL
tara:strand:+ start:4914 stop:5132 length:219 start_codon:yes stop_codon:yes gene_type:complete